MTRRIDDVNAVSVPFDGGIFSQNRNASLTLLIIGIHHTLGSLGAATEGTRLLQ